MKTNRLAHEKSPYLQQHSTNPVDWYPWCSEAFEKAKELAKPIFLSIGYSTCHWCHVMEHESFSDPEVAEVLNEVFVCIKVDREERPDIDAFYMKVCQTMTGSGGWPLTIIMTPDKKPFFAGTYFPKDTRHNRIGLVDLARNVKRVWETRREDVEKSANNLIEYLKKSEFQYQPQPLGEDYIKSAFQSLTFSFDSNFGGFGSAPKFPTPQNFLFLLDYFFLSKENFALEMVEKTLTKMRLGGIFDHIGFGFHRYSTDVRWLVPHFEKMLYDQAMLLLAYSRTYRITKNEFYLKVAIEIVEYVWRELLFENRAFYSSEDADSEGVEGKFYLFEFDEIRQIVGQDFDLFAKVFNVHPNGNFEDVFGENNGKNILHLSKTTMELSRDFDLDSDALTEKMEFWRSKIFQYRETREKPFKDKKILTDWNGLMIAALSNYYLISKRNDILKVIENYLEFFSRYLLKEDGSIYHLFIDHVAKVDGFIDDYAFSIFGFLEVFENTGNHKFLKLGKMLLDKSISLFWSEEQNAFLTSEKDKCETAFNTAEFFDGAVPSGNSVMYYNLNRYYLLTGDVYYLEIANKLEGTFSKLANENPLAYNFFNYALQKNQSHSCEIVVVYSNPNDKDVQNYQNFFNNNYIPNCLVVFYNPFETEGIDSYFWKDYQMRDGVTTAYLCTNFACSEPITNFELFVAEFERKINAK